MDDTNRHIPFDQYERYFITAKIATFLHLKKKVLKVLDIGGYLGYPDSPIQENFLPIKHFLPNDNIVTIDTKPFQGEKYVHGDAIKLPVKDLSFDLVILLDVLEHVPKENRGDVIREAMRVSKNTIVIGGPIKTPVTVMAEKLLASYIATYLETSNPALDEHIKLGLPTHEEIISCFNSEKLEYHHFSQGNIFRWLEMMFLKHLLSMRHGSEHFHKYVDSFYNVTIPWQGNQEPCYRKFYVVARKPCRKFIHLLREHFPVEYNLTKSEDNLPSFLNQVLTHINIYRARLLEKIVDEKNITIKELQHQIQLKDYHIDNLERFKQKIETSIMYQLYKKLVSIYK